MVTDVTTNTAAAYLALRRTFEDLTRLGTDFGEALREAGYELSDSEEYSHSPNALVVKRNHAWLFSKPLDEARPRSDQVLEFASCFIYFEALDTSKWKCGPPGRPELWFFAGRTTPPPSTKWSALIHLFFDAGEVRFFKTKPQLGGSIHQYSLHEKVENWDVVCLGFELSQIASAEDLKTKAVLPLLDAARSEKILEK
jgi:hypothetical protein